MIPLTLEVEARRSNLRHRPVGLGVQGLADAFLMMKMPFESGEAKQLNEEWSKVMGRSELLVQVHQKKRWIGESLSGDVVVWDGSQKWVFLKMNSGHLRNDLLCCLWSLLWTGCHPRSLWNLWRPVFFSGIVIGMQGQKHPTFLPCV